MQDPTEISCAIWAWQALLSYLDPGFNDIEDAGAGSRPTPLGEAPLAGQGDYWRAQVVQATAHAEQAARLRTPQENSMSE